MPTESLGTDPGAGISGLQTTLEGATTGPIGMVSRFTLGGLDVEKDIDITTMNSAAANSRFKSFIAGLLDAKEVSMDLVYERVNFNLVLGALGSANQAWTLTFPDGSTLVVAGYVKHLGAAIPMDDKITQTTTIKFSGLPVFHAASGG